MTHTINTNVATTHIKSDEQHEIVESMINRETKRRVALVPYSKAFGIMTACWIDMVWVLVSEYDLPNDVAEELKAA